MWILHLYHKVVEIFFHLYHNKEDKQKNTIKNIFRRHPYIVRCSDDSIIFKTEYKNYKQFNDAITHWLQTQCIGDFKGDIFRVNFTDDDILIEESGKHCFIVAFSNSEDAILFKLVWA